ncbi:MCE family protein [Rhodococcus erythropolis]|uniref:Putative Mce family protein n=1 Tax=Rhodococcus erythropolis (strain PR4 / NBRC 100887) TaxID=234621 RepID=C0ZR64_RHOE4|nr:MCE family protein [Rhodococcus erythropolis]BAH31614.1 putative Mce family protein [Rhodococcus erythropolis PR4]
MTRQSVRIVAGIVIIGVGSVAVFAFGGCSAGIQDLPLGRSADGDAYNVALQLAGADGLVLGADVRSGQKVIGRVSALSADVVGADVTLSLDAATPLPDNVEASVELPSALGNPFIRLLVPEVPSGSMLSDGDTIPESRTEIGPQVESALATLGTVLTGSGIDQLDTVVRELNTAFSGRSGEVRSLTDTLTSLMAEASSHRSEFDEAVDLAARVSSQLAGQRVVVDNYLDSVPQVVSILVGQKDQIASLLNSTVQLATNANTILDSSPDGLDAMLHDASTVVGTLDSFNWEIGQTLANMNGLLENFTSAVQGDYLVFDGALDIPGTIDKLWSGGMAGQSIAPAGTLTDLLQGGLR